MIEQHVNGRPRKNYRITPGRKALAEARRKMAELVGEVARGAAGTPD